MTKYYIMREYDAGFKKDFWMAYTKSFLWGYELVSDTVTTEGTDECVRKLRKIVNGDNNKVLEKIVEIK